MANQKFRSLSGRKQEDLAPHVPLLRDLMTVLGSEKGMIAFDAEYELTKRKVPEGNTIQVINVKNEIITFAVPKDDGVRQLYRFRLPAEMPVGKAVAVMRDELPKINWRARAVEIRNSKEQKKSENPPAPPVSRIPRQARLPPTSSSGLKIQPVDGSRSGFDTPPQKLEIIRPTFKRWRTGPLPSRPFKRTLAKIFPEQYLERSIFVAILKESSTIELGQDRCEVIGLTSDSLRVTVLFQDGHVFWRQEAEIQLLGDVPPQQFEADLRSLATPPQVLDNKESAPPDSIPADVVPTPPSEPSGPVEALVPIKTRKPRLAGNEAGWYRISKNREAQKFAVAALFAVAGKEIAWLTSRTRNSLRTHLPPSMANVDPRSIGKGFASLASAVAPPLVIRHKRKGSVKRIGFQLTDAGLALAEWDSSRTPVPTKKPKSVKKVTFSSPPVESIENELPRLMKLVKPVLKSLVSIEEMEAVRDELQADIDASIAKLPPKVLDAWRKLQQIQSQMKALYKKKK